MLHYFLYSLVLRWLINPMVQKMLNPEKRLWKVETRSSRFIRYNNQKKSGESAQSPTRNSRVIPAKHAWGLLRDGYFRISGDLKRGGIMKCSHYVKWTRSKIDKFEIVLVIVLSVSDVEGRGTRHVRLRVLFRWGQGCWRWGQGCQTRQTESTVFVITM